MTRTVLLVLMMVNGVLWCTLRIWTGTFTLLPKSWQSNRESQLSASPEQPVTPCPTCGSAPSPSSTDQT